MRSKFTGQRRKLDRKVSFERQGADKNAFNEVNRGNWAELFNTRCAMYPTPNRASGAEKYDIDRTQYVAMVIIEVRSEVRTEALLTSDRAMIDGKAYEIISFEQPKRDSNIRIVAVNQGELT
jgi:hypothetical protein